MIKVMVVLSVLFTFYLIYEYFLFFLILKIWASKKTYVIYNLNESDLSKKISIIISAYNEEKVIYKKLENITNLNYPKKNIEIVVVNDCSDDKTEDEIKRFIEDYNDIEVVYIKNLKRSGKSVSLNKAIKMAKGEYILLTDANIMFDKDYLKNLIKSMKNSKIGAVRGHLIMSKDIDNITLSDMETSYWDIEEKVGLWEYKIKTAINLPGAGYLMRKDLYELIPEDRVIMDDFFESMAILKKGYIIAYSVDALMYEAPSREIWGEFKRRIRIATANFNIFPWIKELLFNFKDPIITFFIYSHKIFRWFSFIPFIGLYIIAFVSLIFYFNNFTFILNTLLLVQLLLSFMYAKFPILNYFKYTTIIKYIDKIFKANSYFTLSQIAFLIGFFRSLKKTKPYWERVER